MKPNLDLFHSPTFGSDVEDWIKQFRDRFPKDAPSYATLNELLTDYRQRASDGVDLDYGGPDYGRALHPGDETFTTQTPEASPS